jgi:hypothetical protein
MRMRFVHQITSSQLNLKRSPFFNQIINQGTNNGGVWTEKEGSVKVFPAVSFKVSSKKICGVPYV